MRWSSTKSNCWLVLAAVSAGLPSPTRSQVSYTEDAPSPLIGQWLSFQQHHWWFRRHVSDSGLDSKLHNRFFLLSMRRPCCISHDVAVGPNWYLDVGVSLAGPGCVWWEVVPSGCLLSCLPSLSAELLHFLFLTGTVRVILIPHYRELRVWEIQRLLGRTIWDNTPALS